MVVVRADLGGWAVRLACPKAEGTGLGENLWDEVSQNHVGASASWASRLQGLKASVRV